MLLLTTHSILLPYTTLFRSVQCIPVRTFSKKKHLIFFTKQGMVKKSRLDEYQAARFSRSLIALNLRDGDEVVKDRKSTRLNSSHVAISYAVFCLKKKTNRTI